MPAPTLITDSDLSGLLKNLYNNYREKVQNLVTPLFSQIQKAKSGGPRNLRWGGNGAYWDVVTGRPAGGTISVGGYFPPDTFAQEKQASTGVARAYVTRQIDGLAFLGTKSKEAAFATIAEKTMAEIREASALLMQGALQGAGAGVLATVGTVTDSVTVIVSNPYGVTGAGQGSLLISVGDYVAFRSSTGVTLRTGKATVNSIAVSGTNSTLTLSASCAAVVADVVVKATTTDDSFAATAGVGQINGLINISNRGNSYGTLHNLAASTYPIWDAVRLVAGTDTPDASQPTESDIWTLIKAVAGRSGKDAMLRPQEFLLMMTPGMAKGIMESTVGQRRFDSSQFATKIRAGYKAINICGIDAFEDYYCPANTIYLLHLPSLAWVDAKDWGFVEFEGAGPWRWIAGRDAFETNYGYYGNFAALSRNAVGSITSYTNDTTFFTHVI
jgi:hypothetical protein